MEPAAAGGLHHVGQGPPRPESLLSRFRAAYVVTSGLGLLCVPRATTDFVYVRMHGPDAAYAGSYSTAQLRCWAERIAQWQAENRRVLVYFNNDGGGHAVRNALELRELVQERSVACPSE